MAVKPVIRRKQGAWVCGLPGMDPHRWSSLTSPKDAWMHWALARKAAGLLPWG